MTSKDEVTKLDDSSNDESIDNESIDSESGSENEDDGFPQIINHFFTNDNGENIASILSDIKKSLDTHNKLIYKLLQSQSLNSDKKKH